MKDINKIWFLSTRFYLTLGFISIVVLGLVWRVFDLSILDQRFLRHQGDERVLRLINTPPFRGMILDRNNFPLAVSASVYSVWFNPQEITLEKSQRTALAKLTGIKAKDIQSIIQETKQKKREFVYLKRALPPEVGQEIKALQIPGIYLQEEYRRYYPEGEVASHVIGITNIDDKGQEGIELAYERWLQGEAGKKWVIKDRLGRVIADLQTLQEQKSGHDLNLSIDKRIQYVAYRELLAGAEQHQAVAASAVVLDAKTGEVLAMVNYPSFNPNTRPFKLTANLRNRAVTDTFEPGSTIKAFTVASALESGKYTMHSKIDTSPGWMRVDHSVVKDEKNNGVISMAEILQRSSNMGAAKLVLDASGDRLFELLLRVGFGEITGIEFPGEQSGRLLQRYPWGAFMQATLSFGYGLSVTTLQLARAYGVLANDGVKLPISLLRLDKEPQGTRVMDSKVVREMLLLLETVVTEGSGKKAQVPGYRVAGKTGTTKLANAGSYEKHRYISSFVGVAPVDNPKLVIAVVIQEPQGKDYLGGAVAGPVFSKIMEESLRFLNVPPSA